MSVLNLPKVLNQKIRLAFAMINDSLANYQAKSEKDEPNGYLGANANGLLNPDQIETDSNNLFVSQTEKDTWNNPTTSEIDHKTTFFWECNFLTIPETNSALNTYIGVQNGAGTTASSGLAYLSPSKNLRVSRPRAMINTSSAGYITLFLSLNNIYFSVGTRVTIKWVISHESVASITSDSGVRVGLFNTKDGSPTQGIGFSKYGNVNNNKWILEHIENSSSTKINSTNINLDDKTLTELKMVINFTSGVIEFYIDNTLVSSSIRDISNLINLILYSEIIHKSNVTSDAFSKVVYPHYASFLLESI